MKSNICKLNEDLTCLKAVLAEVEKVTTYNGLEDKKALRLRLLAEELCGMLPGLIENFSGKFWAENDGDDYKLHVELKADDMNIDLRDELISVSKSGKNAAVKGDMGKIRAVAETMLLTASDTTLSAEEREIGGLGIFMVKKMTESMEYEYTDGKNVLTLVIALK